MSKNKGTKNVETKTTGPVVDADVSKELAPQATPEGETIAEPTAEPDAPDAESTDGVEQGAADSAEETSSEESSTAPEATADAQARGETAEVIHVDEASFITPTDETAVSGNVDEAAFANAGAPATPTAAIVEEPTEPEVVTPAVAVEVVAAPEVPTKPTVAPEIEVVALPDDHEHTVVDAIGEILVEYRNEMRPGNIRSINECVVSQRKLLRAYHLVIGAEGELFDKAITVLMDNFAADRKGAFSEGYVHRAVADMRMNGNTQKFFNRFTSFVCTVCDKTSRPFTMGQVDLSLIVELIPNEDGRQRLLEWANRFK